ncbi:sensor histidine kinase [Magnetospirillum aberrantis]|uniref:histidine kinase n=1 Tax=Magnetospirillum aberrantis SpK TaxID=908842 RepID=A0A7C9V1E9_9PROT|nr:ATP-binding protein [Magnetospirillum aberrantis]NFV82095.1 PAS domain S-box protein [Magnetospirillum aberrantis SpK]
MGAIISTRSAYFALALAAIYAIFGTIWIAVSDLVVAMLVHDPITLTTVQTWKGWFFVGISALLIYGVGVQLLRAIEHSENRYRMLFADSPEALALYDPESLCLVEINDAAGRLFGYDPAEARGLSFTDLMPQETRVTFEASLPRLIDGERGGVWRMRCKDGRPLDVATYGRMVLVGGRYLRLVQIVDVTAKLKAERELMRSLEEVAAANERMRELSHALSHDLQEPLRQVGSFVQLLAKRYDSQLDAEGRQFIAYTVEGIARLKALIGDAERFALTSGFVPMRVSLGRLVADTVEGLRTVIESCDAEIVARDLPWLDADPGKLAVVLHALLGNALKFRRPGVPPKITVEARQIDKGWQVRVVDNGIGIEAEFREAVFSLFSRLHTRDRIPGNGTGLALARKLVEAHGGRIWIEDGNDGGVAVCFTLPA